MRLDNATSHDECRRVGPGGVELEEHCTYLHLGFVAASAAELQILTLLVAMEQKLPFVYFRLALLEYMTGSKSKLITMNVRW